MIHYHHQVATKPCMQYVTSKHRQSHVQLLSTEILLTEVRKCGVIASSQVKGGGSPAVILHTRRMSAYSDKEGDER